MKIKYELIKKYVEHCGDCGEELSGNNCMGAPYECSCGRWESESFDNPSNFVLNSSKEGKK